MALIRDVIFKPPPTLRKLVKEEVKKFNLRILDSITIKFDPFREDVGNIRDFSYLIHTPEARATNQKFVIKSIILTDRSEHTLTFDLSNQHKFIFKCANLQLLEICKLINQHITPLSPKEEVVNVIATKLQKKKK